MLNSYVPFWKWEMDYPAFTDMYGLVDRGDVVFSAAQTAIAIQCSHPVIGPIILQDLKKDAWKKMIKTLVFINCWFHGAVDDRRKIVKWMQSEHEEWFVSEELRIFVLCTLAYGLAAGHRELGNVSEVKLDLIVATVLAISLQFDEDNLEKFHLLPRTLFHVEEYIRNELVGKYEMDFRLYQRMFNTDDLPCKTSIAIRTCLEVSNSLSQATLARLGNIPTTENLYLKCMKLVQPIVVNFHEQLCPTYLTFDGLLNQLYKLNGHLKQIAVDTKIDIFGTSEPQQDSLLDSFLPPNMTREEAGLQPRGLRQLVQDQINCALLRGKLAEFKKQGLMPKHLAIIMDGNRRYAREHKFENVLMGYMLGGRQMMQVFPWCFSAGVRCLTLWAMSSDNFSRDPEEVKGLVTQLTCFFEDLLLIDATVPVKGVRVRVSGDLRILPKKLRDAIKRAEKATEKNSNFFLQIAINYGGRDEIVMACKDAIKQLGPENYELLQTKHITQNLYTQKFGIDLVDSILRTSGEIRLSGFHLWESNSCEFVFLEPKWPELTEVQLLTALVDLATRQRRNGK